MRSGFAIRWAAKPSSARLLVSGGLSAANHLPDCGDDAPWTFIRSSDSLRTLTVRATNSDRRLVLMKLIAKWISCVLLAVASVAAQQLAPLKLIQTIPLPGVAGKFDHYSFDAKRNRLYLAASGNKTVEVVDLAGAKPLQSIPGFQKAQGIKYVAEFAKLFVTD